MTDGPTPQGRVAEVEQIASTPFGEQYVGAGGRIEDAQAFVTDLLANLRHFCDSRELDFGALDKTAHQHYLCELQEARLLAGGPK